MVPDGEFLCLSFRTPLLGHAVPLPHLPWGLAEGRVGTSLPLGTVPRPQDSRGSWPWGAVGVVGRLGGGGGEHELRGARGAGETGMGGSRLPRRWYKTQLYWKAWSVWWRGFGEGQVMEIQGWGNGKLVELRGATLTSGTTGQGEILDPGWEWGTKKPAGAGQGPAGVRG